MNAPNAPDATPVALRAEHDDLARRLEVRLSVDELRKALVRLFVGLIVVGVAVKLGWDRWGVLRPGVVRKVHDGPPVFLWIATALAVVLLVLAVRALLRARRLSRDEDRLYSRFLRLRAELGLDR
jgi:heme exporter protein D